MQKHKIHSLLFTTEKYNLECLSEVYSLGIRITFIFQTSLTVLEESSTHMESK